MMADSTENLHELVHPEAEAVNVETLHDSLEASSAECHTNDTDRPTPTDDAILTTAGDSPAERANGIDEANANDHVDGTIVARKSESLAGWVTKSKCCDEFNKKLFGSKNETEPQSSIAANYRDSSTKAIDSPDFKAKLDAIIDRLEDFVYNTTKQIDKIDKKLKQLANPNESHFKKLDWSEEL